MGQTDPVVPLVATPTVRRVATVIAWDGIDDDSPAARAQRALLKMFHEQFPAVRIDLKPRPPVEIAERVLAMALASRSLPDLYGGLTPDLVPGLAEQKALAPIEQHTRDWKLAGRVVGRAWDPFKTGAHVYGIPNSADVMGLVWRKDHFAEAGLDPEKPPRSWDELVAHAKKLTRPDGTRAGYGLLGGLQAPEHWQNAVYQANGTLVEPAEKGKLKLTFASAAGVEALRFYQDLRGRHGVTQPKFDANLDALMADLLDGRIGMTIGTVAMLGRLAQDRARSDLIGFGALPAGPRGQRAGAMRATGYGFLAASSADARAAAWTYAAWVVDPEQRKAYWQELAKLGGAVTIEASLIDGLLQAEHTDQVRRDWSVALQEALAVGVPEYGGRSYVDVHLAEAINFAILKSDADPTAVLRDAAKRVADANPDVIAQSAG